MTISVEGRRRFRGVLLGTQGDAALVRRDDDAAGDAPEVLLPIAEIAEARLVLTDALVAESLRRGKHRGLQPDEALGDVDEPEGEAPPRKKLYRQHKGSRHADQAARPSADFQPAPPHRRRVAQHEGE